MNEWSRVYPIFKTEETNGPITVNPLLLTKLDDGTNVLTLGTTNPQGMAVNGSSTSWTPENTTALVDATAKTITFTAHSTSASFINTKAAIKIYPI